MLAGNYYLSSVLLVSLSTFLLHHCCPPPGHRLCPQSISLSGLFLSLLSLSLPINHPTLHSPTCICPCLSYHCRWPHYAPLSVTELQHHPDQHQTQQNHKMEVAVLKGFYGSENSGCRGREWRTANPWSGAPLWNWNNTLSSCFFQSMRIGFLEKFKFF